jgi:A/G-specific adenine glycosylase
MNNDEITNFKINQFRNSIIEWGEKNFKSYPWRTTKNKWHALVAEIMLQRTNADQVVPVYEEFVINYSSPSELLKRSETDIFKTLGLRWREEFLHSLARELEKLGYFPEEKEALLNLPGVGNYIAAAFRSFHLNKRDVIIDSNVVRLYGRYFGFSTNSETRRKKWFIEFADHITPQSEFKKYNYAILDFTRSICKTKPKHNECFLHDICSYYAEFNNK